MCIKKLNFTILCFCNNSEIIVKQGVNNFNDHVGLLNKILHRN